MLLSINQISQLTGKDRHTVRKQLEGQNFVDGDKGAHLYESITALPLIYSIDGLEAARAKQALSQASLNKIREEELRRERIPLQTALDVMDETFQSLGATIKAARGQLLTTEKINELFDKFRSAPPKVKWARK